jgi:hypothetical protein
MRPRVPATAYAFCASVLLVLGALAFPVVSQIASTQAGASSLTATAGAALGHTTPSTGTWGSIPTPINTTAPTAGTFVTETFALTLLNPAPQYFFVYNSGSVGMNLAGATYSVGVTTSGLHIGTTPSAILTACVGANWNTSTGACASKSVIGTFTSNGTVASGQAPTTPGSYLSIQTSVGGLNILGLGGSMTVTIKTIVGTQSPRQIRPAIITTS